MARTKISEFSATPNDNTDIDGIDIAEGCAPSGINNAIRELMSQLKDFQTGSAGDPFNGAINGTVGATTPSTVVATQVDITAQGDLRLQDTTGGQYVALQAPGTVATSYTLTLPVDDGTAGQALITDGSGVLSWSSAASGDVYGPGSATDNAVARYDGTTGKIIQNSAVTIGDDGATVIAANSSSDGLRITQTGAGNALLVEDSANPDSSPFAILSNGQVIQGATQSYTTTVAGTNYNPTIQMHAANANTPAIGYEVANWATTTGAGSFSFAKSRGGVIGTHTVVNSNDSVGETYYFGSDGTNFIEAARIGAAVDGTPGTNDMPGRLVFSTTADGASSPTERMRITSTGAVGIGTSSLSAYGLRVSKTSDGASFVGIGSTGSGSAAATSSVFNFYSVASTASNSGTPYTIPVLRHYDTVQSAFNADSTVTNQIGFNAGSLTGATNNYGFYGNIASGTGRWNFYAAGTAANYFAGATQIASSLKAGRNATQYIEMSGDSGGNYLTGVSDIGLPKNFAIGTDANSASLIIRTGNAQVINFQTNNTSRATIDATGVISLGAAPGAESLRVTPVASAVNYYTITGGVTTGSPYLAAQGSDANIHSQYLSKGTFGHIFNTGSAGNFQFYVAHTASAVNYLQATGAATGGNPVIAAAGTDTNISLSLTPKGTGGLLTISTGQTVAGITTTTLGGSVSVFDSGTSAGNGGSVMFGAASGAWRFAAIKSNVTSGSNNTQGDLYFLTRRVSTDANLTAAAHITGAGVISLGSIQGSESVRVSPVASAVNFWDFVGSATGTFIGAYASGSDTNIDMKLIPKGTGVLQFGTYTAGIIAQAGYITIKDAGGTTRRLLVG